MNMVIIPYEFIEALFGKTVADNFDTIVMICMMIGVAIVLLGLKRKTKPRRYEKEEPVEKAPPRVFESTTGKWSPTGWCFNDNTGKWEPPEYLSEESRKKWRWDAQKQVWIDVEKERRMERYRKNREGKPPTYEEWKSGRLAGEEQKKG